MGVVDHEQNNLRETVVMATCQIAEVVKRRVIAAHAEDTVCDDDRTPEGAGCVAFSPPAVDCQKEFLGRGGQAVDRTGQAHFVFDRLVMRLKPRSDLRTDWQPENFGYRGLRSSELCHGELNDLVVEAAAKAVIGTEGNSDRAARP